MQSYWNNCPKKYRSIRIRYPDCEPHVVLISYVKFEKQSISGFTGPSINPTIRCTRLEHAIYYTSSLAKAYDPLYSSSSLASLDGFSRSHGDGLYVMQLVLAATNQNVSYRENYLEVYIGTHKRFIQRTLLSSVYRNIQTFHTDNIIWKCTLEHTNVSYRENYLVVYIGTYKRFI
jgi:hypothetical protein